jgi:hypothetical protein
MSIGVEVETRRAVTFVSTKEDYDDGTGTGGLVRDERMAVVASHCLLERNENGGKK